MLQYKLVAILAVEPQVAKTLTNKMLEEKEYPVLEIAKDLDNLLIIGEENRPILVGCHLVKLKIAGEGNECKCNDNGIIAVSGKPVSELSTVNATGTGTTYPISRAKRK